MPDTEPTQAAERSWFFRTDDAQRWPAYYADPQLKCRPSPASPDGFRVSEIPFENQAEVGESARTWHLLIRKRGISTPEAARRLAEALGAAPATVSWAGMKDIQSEAQQWLSLPAHKLDAPTAQSIDDTLEILQCRPAKKGLKAGQLAGNRFEIALQAGDAQQYARLERALGTLARRGLPNYFGPQRWRRPVNAKPDARMTASRIQAEISNDILAKRLRHSCANAALPGDHLGSPGDTRLSALTETRSPASLRHAGSYVTTPIWGPRAEDARDCALLLEWPRPFRAERRSLRTLPRAVTQGARRATWIFPEAPSIHQDGKGQRWLCFTLRSGAYASGLLRELFDGESARLGAPWG